MPENENVTFLSREKFGGHFFYAEFCTRNHPKNDKIMKRNVYVLFVIMWLVTLCSCSPVTYYAKGKSGMPCPEIPVMEPFTEIGSFKTRYFQREHDDSLTSIAHEAMMEVLGENGEEWHLGDVITISDSAEYETIRQEIYTLLKSSTTKKNHPSDFVAFKPANGKKLKEKTLPASLLDYMKRNELPYVMILLQNGFEPHPEYKPKGWHILTREFEAYSSKRTVTELECLVADAQQNRIYFYTMSGHVDATPTVKEELRIEMNDLFADYSHKNSITQKDIPKKYGSIYWGYGQIYPSPYGDQGRDIDSDNYSFGVETYWPLSKSPFSAGFTLENNDHLIAIDDYTMGKRIWVNHDNMFLAPAIGLYKIVADRHMFSLGLSAGLMVGSTPRLYYNGTNWRYMKKSYEYNYHMAEKLSLSYNYRFINRTAIGIMASAYTFNDWLSKKAGPKPIVPMWNVSLCWTILIF